jgi:uncharacterized membrane protein YfcA
MELPTEPWFYALLGTFIIGLGKGGVKGLDILSVMLMAMAFGSKRSTGIVLPLLCIADVAAVYWYRRHAQWNHVRRLIPWMLAGVFLGLWVGMYMDELLFTRVMAAIIIATIAIVLWMEVYRKAEVPHNPVFVAGTGLASGFTSMIGNLAGAFANIYFLAIKAPKNGFIGTSAWLFLIMNLFKLPLQAFYWKNIDEEGLRIDLRLLPALGMGFLAGTLIVSRIRDESYRRMVLVLTFVGCIMMFLRK